MLNNNKNYDANAIAHYTSEYQRFEKELVGYAQKYLSQIRLDGVIHGTLNTKPCLHYLMKLTRIYIPNFIKKDMIIRGCVI